MSLLILLSVVLLAVLKLLGVMTLPLTGNEAYYWIWSKHPALGYYDHPPLVAWLTAASTALFGDTPLGIRFFALPLYFLVLFLCPWMAREAGGGKTAQILSPLFFLLTPFLAAEFYTMSPDIPLLAFWTASLFCILKGTNHPEGVPGSGRFWRLLAGISAGLAMLSKLTGLLLLPILALSVMVLPRKKDQGMHEALLFTLLPALLVVSPFLIWSSQHHWETFLFQGVTRHLADVSLSPSHIIKFLTNQAITLTPLIFPAALIAVWVSLRKGIAGDGRHLFLALASLIPFGFFLAWGFVRTVELGWPLIWIPSAFISLAIWVEDRWKSWPTPARGYIIAGISLASLLFSLLTVLILSPQLVAKASARLGRESSFGNGMTVMSAWEKAAPMISDASRKMPPPTFLMTEEFGLASLGTYYLGQRVVIPGGNLKGREYQRGMDYLSLRGRNALYFSWNPPASRPEIREIFSRCFSSFEEYPPAPIISHGVVLARLYLVRCINLKDWKLLARQPQDP